jgi:hypothetical protein
MNSGSTNAFNYLVIAALVVWVLTRQLQARPVVVRVSLGVQGAVVYWRGLRSGAPFAVDPRRVRV